MLARASLLVRARSTEAVAEAAAVRRAALKGSERRLLRGRPLLLPLLLQMLLQLLLLLHLPVRPLLVPMHLRSSCLLLLGRVLPRLLGQTWSASLRKRARCVAAGWAATASS